MMHCPLCSGPVTPQGDSFVCEVGHRADRGAVARLAETRLTEALWMAVQALDNEAEVLRRLGDTTGHRFAEEAAGQSRVLREFAHANALRLN